jgi:hypothetical protein
MKIGEKKRSRAARSGAHSARAGIAPALLSPAIALYSYFYFFYAYPRSFAVRPGEASA